jgi:hypothetical protein
MVILVTRFRVQSVISAPFLYPIILHHRNTKILCRSSAITDEGGRAAHFDSLQERIKETR